MLISKAAGIVALGLAGVTATTAVRAATLETQAIENWTLNAFSSEKTGAFRNCTMRTAGNDQVYLTVSANARNRWHLSLYRPKWDLEPDARFVATLNLDQDLKQPIALEAKVANERYVALLLPTDRHVLDLLSTATKARVSRESKAYTFSLVGYDKAVQWVKACVVRNMTLDGSKPDGTIKGEEDDTDAAGGEVPKDKPAETPKATTPKLPTGIIEVKADDTAKPDVVAAALSAISSLVTLAPVSTPPATPAAEAEKPVVSANTLVTPTKEPLIRVEKPVTPSTQVASLPASTSVPPMSDAAKASPMPIVEPPIATVGPAQRLLPNLMAAANRSDFKLLDASAAPEPLKRADVVFSLTGMTGVVMAFDLPTADAATNEVLAYDRIACGGAYTAVTSPVEDGHSDVLRSTSECTSGDKSVLAHYLTLSRKSGGFYVVALTSETSVPSASGAIDKLAAADRALFDAAIKVSGKF